MDQDRVVADRGDVLLLPTLLLVVGLLAWGASLPNIVPAELGGLGIITILPPLMWLAYASIIAGFCLSLLPATIRTPLPFLFLIAFVLLLHATPAISYETLRYSWAWKHIGVIDYIMRNGKLDPNADYLSAYHNWPTFFLVAAWIADWLKLEPLQIADLARFFPTALNLAFVCVLPLLLGNFTSDRRLIWISVALFLGGNWIGQDYFSPQGTAFLFHLGALALLTGPLAAGVHSEVRRSTPALSLVALALIIAIVATHQITPLFLLSALFCLAAVKRLSFGYFLFALVAELLWMFYMAEPFLAPRLADLLGDFGRVGPDTVGRLVSTDIVSDDQVIVSMASRGLSAAIAIGAMAGLALRFRSGHRDLVALALLVATVPVLFATSYGGEIVFRVYLFSMPCLAFFMGALFVPADGRRGHGRLLALGVVLAAIVPAFLLANNGKDAQYWFSPAEVQAADYLYGRAEPGQLLIEAATSYPSQFRNYENFIYVPLTEELPTIREELLTAPDVLLASWLRGAPAGGYIVITRSQKAMFDALGFLPQGALGQIERALIASPELTVVFANSDATVLSLKSL